MDNKTLVVDWLISLQHALRIINTFNKKQHRFGDWAYELEDLGITFGQLDSTHKSSLKRRAQYQEYKTGPTLAYRMKIWRGKTTADEQRNVNTS
jgi:hypothetical protein